jgi:hypothetical protein
LDHRGQRLLLILSRRWLKSPTNKIEMDWEKSSMMNSGHVGDNPIGLTDLTRTPYQVRKQVTGEVWPDGLAGSHRVKKGAGPLG